MNGHIRTTEDIDVLLDDDESNLKKAIQCIYEIFPGIQEELSIGDIKENVVLKIMDDFEVDFTIKAWTVGYAEADKDKKITVIDGIEIPFMGIDVLIKSKDTYREIDKWDVKVLNEIKRSGK